MAKKYVDEYVTVNDDEIARAILYLLETEKSVAEGAGAAFSSLGDEMLLYPIPRGIIFLHFYYQTFEKFH